LKLAVTSAGFTVIKDKNFQDNAEQSKDHRLLTKQIVANQNHHEPKRIYTEGVNFNKTFYKGKRLERLGL
jgi:hypothetical protein